MFAEDVFIFTFESVAITNLRNIRFTIDFIFDEIPR